MLQYAKSYYKTVIIMHKLYTHSTNKSIVKMTQKVLLFMQQSSLLYDHHYKILHMATR